MKINCVAAGLAALILVVATNASGQSARVSGAISGMAKSLSDMAERQAAIDAEIEVAKAKAAIELETHRRKLQMEADARRQSPKVAPALAPAPPPTLAPDEQDAAINRLHPQWRRIVLSNAFNSWLSLQAVVFQDMCKKTNEAIVLGRCIDSFLNAKVAAAE